MKKKIQLFSTLIFCFGSVSTNIQAQINDSSNAQIGIKGGLKGD
jgi:hypothetical protein